MNSLPLRPANRAAALAVAAVLLATAAHADDDHVRGPMLPLYVQECGSCHVAFPPGLLNAASWDRVMNGLAKHYGSDASLDAAAARSIAIWLRTNAAAGRRATQSPPEDRITRGAWFRHEHHEVPTAAWQRASIGSPANCGACHPGAADGRYAERDIRIPR